MLSNTSPIYGPHSYESTRGPVMAMAQKARSLQLPRLKNTTSKEMMTDLPQIQAVEGACKACLQGKQHKKPFPSVTSWRAKAVLELIHTDVCGPMRTPSHEQNRYFILFIDDYSRMTWVYFMREKSEVFKVFKKFKNLVEKQSGRSIKVLRSDRGKNITTQNSTSSVKKRVSHQGSSKHDSNRSMDGKKPSAKHLRVFGSICYVDIPTEKRDVEFDEDAMWNWDEEKVERQSVMIPKETPPQQQQQEGTDQAEMERRSQQAPGSPRRPPPSEEIEEETPPRRTKLLSDIYEICNFIMLEPENFETAVKHKVWVQAMEEEIDMIEKNNTWELTDKPKDKEVIGVKWIYKTKLNADGSIQKHKARLVAKGYSQLPGIDYTETFAPVARLDTIRALIAIAANKKWKIYQMDVKSAFLNGYIDEEIYVEQPQGFIAKDDLIYTGNNEKMIQVFKEDMMKTFEMSDLGLMHFVLGIEINQEKEGIFICQRKYTETLLKKFKMESCKTVTTPLVTGEKYQKEDGSQKVDGSMYRSLIGSLLYLTATRPDIMFATCLLSRFMQSPSQVHYAAAKRILRYLRGSVDEMKSTSGYTFSLGSGIFSWASKKQATVAQSSAEAEYIAAAATSNQATWLRRILEDMREKQEEPTTIYCDNKRHLGGALGWRGGFSLFIRSGMVVWIEVRFDSRYGPPIWSNLQALAGIQTLHCDQLAIPHKRNRPRQDTIFANRDSTVAARVGSYNGNDISFCPYDSSWRTRRKLFVHDMLSNRSLDATFNLRKDEVRKGIRNIYTKINTPVKICEVAFGISLNAIMSMVWGNTIEGERKDKIGAAVSSLVTRSFDFMGKPNVSDYFPVLARFDIQGVEKEMSDIMQRVDEIIEDIINERTKVGGGGNKNGGRLDFLQILLELSEKQDVKTEFGKTQIKALITDIVMGGTDTSSTTIEWVMIEFMRNPEVMEKAHKELSEVVGLNNIVEEFHIPKLVYLDAVIKESLRIHPTGPLLIPRTPSQSCTVGGYSIPKDSAVIINIWSIQRDPLAWNNPLEFIPERFLAAKE
ncbi:UNVERIFIED_CONTAM: Retrovirus-related Pol polyprotein from transposon RE2 [Sesamum calycinum]|uniref:Retrovirus-related Pol polyprotein from transposon RE2 n=1 Tax=Sesamum calycinum TaxID=2727403 RepID=A0AAW2KX85_9LAMI